MSGADTKAKADTSSSSLSITGESHQFHGRDFKGSAIDPSMPIPASLHLLSGNKSNSLSNVKIAFIGEALGETEENRRRPFVGSTGTDLRLFAKIAGYPIHSAGIFGGRPFYELPNIYFDNVIKIRPTDNDLNTLPPGAFDFWITTLTKQFQSTNLLPNIIVAIGAVATYALCGDYYIKRKKGMVFEGITHWRGSILQTQFLCGQGSDRRPIKVIPVLHPSFIQKQWAKRYLLIHDLQTALKESEYLQRIEPERSYVINPTLQEVKDFHDNTVIAVENKYHKILTASPIGELYTDPNPPVAISADFETRAPFPCSIAFCLDKKNAISIPFCHVDKTPYWTDPRQEAEVWQIIAAIFRSIIPKIGQNYVTYDWFYNKWYGLTLLRMWLDTRYAHKALHPELQSSLEILTSIYTNPIQNFYKEEGKEDHPTFSEEQFWRYNCNDVTTAWEIAWKVRDDLVEEGLWKVYIERYLKLSPHLIKASLRGIKFDTKLASQLRSFYTWLLSEMGGKLNTIVGHPLNVRSTVQLPKYLYKELHLYPIHTGKGKARRVTSDALALYKLRNRYPRHSEVLSLILSMKKAHHRLSNDINVKIDPDNRIRTSYGMGPETGRTASTKSPFRTGRNMQNPERVDDPDNRITNMRNFYTSDHPSLWILQGDLRQAEAMVVAWLAHEMALIEMFLTGADIHTENAMKIFKKVKEEITKRMRYLGKVGSHSGNYNVGPQTLADTILEETEGELVIRPSQTKGLLDSYYGTYPNIRGKFHTWIRHLLDTNMTLHTPPPFNRRRRFYGKQYDDGTYREGYAYIPQSIVPDIIDDAWMELSIAKFDVMHQWHDALYIQSAKESLVKTFRAMRASMTRPIALYPFCPQAYREPLSIPIDFSVGHTMGNLVELKKMEDEEIEDYLNELVD